MIDLDNFKQVNDTKGHPAGDQALIDVAKVLRIRTHPGTVIARVGGEEFLLAQLTTDSTPTDLSRSICQQIAALPVGVTASIGSASIAVDVDQVAGEAADTIDSLIAAADSVMYEAKHAGGNRVRHHPGVTCSEAQLDRPRPQPLQQHPDRMQGLRCRPSRVCRHDDGSHCEVRRVDVRHR
jgi:diguanylate cyclase (GGDEF)-like protein